MARKSRKGQDIIPVSVTTPALFKVYDTAIYVRLSVEDNKNRGSSVETQQYIIENYIALHPDFKVYSNYIDNGTTGTNFDRPAFRQMMEDVESGKVNCIIVKDLSRLGRNTIDTGYYIEKYFPSMGVRFIAINDDYDSAYPSGDAIMLPLKNMINEAYALDIGKKIRTQAHQSMSAGDFIGARPPYGFSKDPQNCHKLIVDEESAAVVRKIFQWAYEKVGLNEIVTLLNAEGIMAPSQYAQSRGLITHENLLGNGTWQTRTVAKILSSEVYTGDMVQGKTKSVDHRQYPVDEADWIVVINTHEAIISHEMFDTVKAYREQVAKECVSRKTKPYSENLLRGRIFCADCQKNLHRQRSHDRYLFHCISNSRIAKGYCSGVCIMENELFEVIMCVIRQKAGAIIGAQLQVEKHSPKLDAHRESIRAELSQLAQKSSQKQLYMKGLYESLIKRDIDKEQYLYMRSGYEDEIVILTQQTRELEQSLKKLEEQCRELADLSNVFKQMRKNTNLTAALVDRLIEKVLVSHDKVIDITFRFRDEFELIHEVCSHA